MHCSKLHVIGPNNLVVSEKMKALGYGPASYIYIPSPLSLKGLENINIYNPFFIDIVPFVNITSGKNIAYIFNDPPKKFKRESKDQYFLKIARLVASRSTCPRRAVGCVIVDKNYHIKATGYNGVPKGFPHCTDSPCGGERHSSGQGLTSCMATHAEQNALLQCPNTMEIAVIYVTTSPCITCAKLIANTSCKTVVYAEEYKDTSGIDMLRKLGVEAICERIID